MRFIFNFGVFLLVFSSIFSCSTVGYQSPRYVKLAHEITANTARKLEKEKKLYLVGTGGGMMHDIQAMHMSFDYYQEVDLQTARELIVYAVREYLSDINNNEEVRPYLHNYPFTAKNVEIRIWVSKPDRSNPSSGRIDYISAINGVLNYYTRGEKQYSRKTIYEETYEEALSKIDSTQGADTVGRDTNEEVIGQYGGIK